MLLQKDHTLPFEGAVFREENGSSALHGTVRGCRFGCRYQSALVRARLRRGRAPSCASAFLGERPSSALVRVRLSAGAPFEHPGSALVRERPLE
jgi:hypothetical protein